jgi:AcrR family transcriptional regulator
VPSSDRPTPRVARGERPAGPTRAAETRRAEIIAAAIQVIARDGIRACTVSALEQETGFARGHFSYHFASKEEIIGLAFATVASDWATAQMTATEGPSALERIESRVRAAVGWVQQRPDYFRCLMTFRVEMMRDPSAFPPAARIRGQMWDFCADMIRQAITEGALPAHLEPDAEARTLFAIVDGMLMYSVLDTGFWPAETLADRVWGIIADRLTGGAAR